MHHVPTSARILFHNRQTRPCLSLLPSRLGQTLGLITWFFLSLTTGTDFSGSFYERLGDILSKKIPATYCPNQKRRHIVPYLPNSKGAFLNKSRTFGDGQKEKLVGRPLLNSHEIDVGVARRGVAAFWYFSLQGGGGRTAKNVVSTARSSYSSHTISWAMWICS